MLGIIKQQQQHAASPGITSPRSISMHHITTQHHITTHHHHHPSSRPSTQAEAAKVGHLKVEQQTHAARLRELAENARRVASAQAPGYAADINMVGRSAAGLAAGAAEEAGVAGVGYEASMASGLMAGLLLASRQSESKAEVSCRGRSSRGLWFNDLKLALGLELELELQSAAGCWHLGICFADSSAAAVSLPRWPLHAPLCFHLHHILSTQHNPCTLLPPAPAAGHQPAAGPGPRGHREAAPAGGRGCSSCLQGA